MSFDIISNWNLIRASGFLAYFLLTLSIMAGLMQRLSTFQKQKQLLMELHKFSGWTGVLTIVFHTTLLLVDHFVPYHIWEILIPFSSKHDPIFSGLGTISLYLFVLVMATSDFFMKKLGLQLWRKLHFLVLPAWVLMLLHGIYIGTDSSQVWAVFLYCGGFVLIITLLIFRYFESRLKVMNSKKTS